MQARVADVLRTTAPRAGQQYEAEDAFTANGATVGTEGVDLAAPRARVVVAVDAARAGDQTVTFRYRNTTGADQDAVLAVDGQPVGRLVLAPRERWGDVAVTLPLRAGLGSVELRRTVDYFESQFGLGTIRRVLAAPTDEPFMKFMRETSEFTGLPVEPLELPLGLRLAAGKPADYGLPEAYLAASVALDRRGVAKAAS